MILIVDEHLIRQGLECLCGLLQSTKHRYVQQPFFLRDELIVQSFSDAQCQNFLGVYIGSQKGIIVIGNANDVRDYTKNRIRIDKKCVSFIVD